MLEKESDVSIGYVNVIEHIYSKEEAFWILAEPFFKLEQGI